MSGRRIRRPPAGAAQGPRACTRQPATAAQRMQRRVMAAGVAILLAGTAATFFLERAVLAPRTQVSTASALPVYSAVGQRTDDVSFWPWTFYADQAGQEPSLVPAQDDHYMQQMLVTFTDALLGGGTEVELAGVNTEAYSDPRCSCQYLRDLPLTWTDEDGTARVLTLDMAYGVGSDPALTFGMAVSFVLQSKETPTEAQLEAAYRQVLLDLWFQCGGAGWLLDSESAIEVMEATPAPADVASDVQGEEGEPQYEAASSVFSVTDIGLSGEALRRMQASARLPIETLMDRLAGPIAEMISPDLYLQWPAGIGLDPALWPPENSPDPAALAGGSMSEADTHKLEQRLQQQYAEYGMELQVVTLSDSVLALFSDGGLTFGLYYDPVLEIWSGIAIQ